MFKNEILSYIKEVLGNMPADWLNLTTHRLDIYDESQAKIQFLENLEKLFQLNNAEASALQKLPTAYDYIRLGHPLSCILEWAIAKTNGLEPKNIVSFSSQTVPILAVLRKNLFEQKNTLIAYTDELPSSFDLDMVRDIYGYTFDLKKVEYAEDIPPFDGSVVFVSSKEDIVTTSHTSNVDFIVNSYNKLGSIITVNGDKNEHYISEIQHSRRRETIAMTPANCLLVLKAFVGLNDLTDANDHNDQDRKQVLESISEITGTKTSALVGSSGLSIQYAIMMGIIDHALEKHEDKSIKIVVPPNCYGGTNDQARRIAASIDNVDVMDLPVDGGNDMVQSIDIVLEKIANEDAVPYIIAEIPTNPRVEVPDLNQLKEVLGKQRKTATDQIAIYPVFILDQTFCPNVHFLGENEILSSIRTISYVSGSKFPSGGLCTAGYCVGNDKANHLTEKIERHLQLCDNEATPLQMETLAEQLPSMNQRINQAYKNTRAFVDFIGDTLPDAGINFVPEELANQGFTPSVFSLDLPTKGNTDEEREAYKRYLNQKLIDLMITEIPNESKYCVSYGQLKGCYWTIPATSTQGTTKEDDKDYIARVALSPNMDLELHKKVFTSFVKSISD